MSLEAYFEKIATLQHVLIAIAVFTVSFAAITILNPKKKIQESLNTSNVTYFAAGRSFGYDPKQLYLMLDAFNEREDGKTLRKEYTRFFYYDFIYPLLYGFSLAVIIAYLQKKWNMPDAASGLKPTEMHYLWTLPLLAMVFDYAENISLLLILKNYEGEPLPLLAGFSRLMTMLKLLLLYASFFLYLCLIALWIWEAIKPLFVKSANQSAS
ncbi:MAG TPA: hypothetical protein VGN95_02540 [Pyrinomonadaceae bacterium]|jgi:hypothetical protein|nr:hypothetical protein [Pyrinomonadaceae bacterium]